MLPDWVAVPEVAQPPRGPQRPVVLPWGWAFHLFRAIRNEGQVDRDLLLLYEASAERKLAILIDRRVDSAVSEAFYRKKPKRPFPAIWASDVLFENRRTTLHLKLTEAVLGQGWAVAAQAIRQVVSTGTNRMLKRWRAEGLEITLDLETVSHRGVFVFLVWKRLRDLGCEPAHCKDALFSVAEAFDFIMRQTLFGVPMILRVTRQGASVLDLGDHEMVVWGSLLEEEGDPSSCSSIRSMTRCRHYKDALAEAATGRRVDGRNGTGAQGRRRASVARRRRFLTARVSVC